jgi:hypothetical protein
MMRIMPSARALARHLAVWVGTTVVTLLAAALGEGQTRPTPEWLAFQLVPSVELLAGDPGAGVGLRWQLTPLAYSFAAHRGLSSWRVFVVEPNLRYGGSVEGYLAPGAFFGPTSGTTLRVGARAYIPLLERGEALSLSVAASYRHLVDQSALLVEVGLHAVYGIVGLTVGVAVPEQPLWLSVALMRRRSAGLEGERLSTDGGHPSTAAGFEVEARAR